MGIWKDATRKDWRYRFEHHGENYAGGGFRARREAVTAREARRKEVKNQVAARTITATAFSVISNDYLDFAQRKYVKDVYQRKAFVYRNFLKTIDDISIDQVTPRDIHDYLKTLKSNSLYNEHRQELSALFNWAKKIHSAQLPYLINPCIGVEAMSHVTDEKEIPTQEEILRIIAAASPGDERDIVITCLQTLGRIDEVLRLRWHEDVNFEKKYIVLWTRKRKNGAYEPDALPMNKDLYGVLWNRWNIRKQDKWVFYNSATDNRFMARPKMMAAICRRAGITRYGFHSLRHFMASYLLDEEKASLKTVSGMLRHKQARTTELYLHVPDGSKVATMGKIEGKFTSFLIKPQASAASIKTVSLPRAISLS